MESVIIPHRVEILLAKYNSVYDITDFKCINFITRLVTTFLSILYFMKYLLHIIGQVMIHDYLGPGYVNP